MAELAPNLRSRTTPAPSDESHTTTPTHVLVHLGMPRSQQHWANQICELSFREAKFQRQRRKRLRAESNAEAVLAPITLTRVIFSEDLLVARAATQIKLVLELEALLNKDVASDEDLGQCGRFHLADALRPFATIGGPHDGNLLRPKRRRLAHIWLSSWRTSRTRWGLCRRHRQRRLPLVLVR